MGQRLSAQELEQKSGEAIHRIDWLALGTPQLANGKICPEHVWQRINQIQQWSVHTRLLVSRSCRVLEP
jgi:hypothetical protein